MQLLLQIWFPFFAAQLSIPSPWTFFLMFQDKFLASVTIGAVKG